MRCRAILEVPISSQLFEQTRFREREHRSGTGCLSFVNEGADVEMRTCRDSSMLLRTQYLEITNNFAARTVPRPTLQIANESQGTM